MLVPPAFAKLSFSVHILQNNLAGSLEADSCDISSSLQTREAILAEKGRIS